MERQEDESRIRALLARIGKQDQRALRELHDLFGRRIYGFAMRHLRNEDDAEMIVSDTLFEVWKHPDRFRGESRFSTWLLGIARNKILMLRRGDKRHRHDELDQEAAERIPDEDLQPPDVLDQKQLAAGMAHCMEGLSPVHQECLHLQIVEELTLEEIAGLQGCPENTVKTRLFHARKNIFECVKALMGRGPRK